jgi:hypothetical protein
MTLPRWEVICKHWERIPPLSISVAAIGDRMGVTRPKPRAQADQDKQANRQGLFDMLGGAGFSTETPAWLRQATTQ